MASSVSAAGNVSGRRPGEAWSEHLGSELASECHDQREDFQALMEDVGASVGAYCRKRPVVATMVVFAVGFYMGWKVKPW